MSTNSFWMVQTWVPSTMSPRSRGVFRNMLSFVSTKVWGHMGGGGGSSFWAALHISGSHTALFSKLLTSPLWLAPLSSSASPSTCLVSSILPNRKNGRRGVTSSPLVTKTLDTKHACYMLFSLNITRAACLSCYFSPRPAEHCSHLFAPMAVHQLNKSHRFLGTLMSPFMGLEAVVKAAYNLGWSPPPPGPRGVQGGQPAMRMFGELSNPLSWLGLCQKVHLASSSQFGMIGFPSLQNMFSVSLWLLSWSVGYCDCVV